MKKFIEDHSADDCPDLKNHHTHFSVEKTSRRNKVSAFGEERLQWASDVGKLQKTIEGLKTLVLRQYAKGRSTKKDTETMLRLIEGVKI